MSVSLLARQEGISASLLFQWSKLPYSRKPASKKESVRLPRKTTESKPVHDMFISEATSGTLDQVKAPEIGSPICHANSC